MGLNLGWNGQSARRPRQLRDDRLRLQRDDRRAVGSFTTTRFQSPINSIGSTDTLTVLGSFQIQHSVQSAPGDQPDREPADRSAQPAWAALSPTRRTAGFTLLGGLTGLPGSNSLYATVAALRHVPAAQYQLGEQRSVPVSVNDSRTWHSKLSYQVQHRGTASAVTQIGAFTPVTPNRPDRDPARAGPGQHRSKPRSGGRRLQRHQHDQPLVRRRRSRSTTPISGRPERDLPTGSRRLGLDRHPGNVQSIRGGSATGMVLNDNGNLNLVKFASVTNSTIVGQPVSHLQIPNRSHVTVLTPARTAGSRNGVTVDKPPADRPTVTDE